jgi:hypothetical protein
MQMNVVITAANGATVSVSAGMATMMIVATSAR